MKRVEQALLLLAGVAILALLAGLATGTESVWRPAAVTAAVATACGIGGIEPLRTYRFTAWIVAAVTVGMLEPAPFLLFEQGDPRRNALLLFMIQTVMFGMGTQMSLRDFVGVARQPWPVFVGILCQFLIMPLAGYGLAVAFRLPPEIAAGVVLLGSCSSGLASNVMCYLARANLALSITLSAVATMLAPVITPFWFGYLTSGMLENSDVDVSLLKMMTDIIKIVITPTGAALVHDYLNHAGPRGRAVVGLLGLAGLLLAADVAAGGSIATGSAGDPGRQLALTLTTYLLGAVTFGLLYHVVVRLAPWVHRLMPAAAMFGIVYVTGITTAEGRHQLAAVGAALFAVALLHNFAGYVGGYWMSRAFGLDRASARTVAFEVGLQNGGMATGLAIALGRLSTLGLAAAIFIPVMNISGSLLANYWRGRPIEPTVGSDNDQVG